MAPFFSIPLLRALLYRFHLQYVLSGSALPAIGRRRLQRETEPVCDDDFIWNWNDLHANSILTQSQLFRIGFNVHDDLCLGEEK